MSSDATAEERGADIHPRKRGNQEATGNNKYNENYSYQSPWLDTPTRRTLHFRVRAFVPIYAGVSLLISVCLYLFRRTT